MHVFEVKIGVYRMRSKSAGQKWKEMDITMRSSIKNDAEKCQADGGVCFVVMENTYSI